MYVETRADARRRQDGSVTGYHWGGARSTTDTSDVGESAIPGRRISRVRRRNTLRRTDSRHSSSARVVNSAVPAEYRHR
jgi:hypothetical protein